MLEEHSIEELRGLVGHEVHDSDGVRVGYVDLFFLDDDTRRPEWIGVWNGTWRAPHVLVPIAGATVEGVEQAIRVPWDAATIERASVYDDVDTRHLVGGAHEHPFHISEETERVARKHYGLDGTAVAPVEGPSGDLVVGYVAVVVTERRPGRDA